MHPRKDSVRDPKKLLFSAETIAERIHRLGASITQDYEGKNLIAVGIMKGSFIFLADLVRHIDLELTVDFVRVASYGAGTDPSGICRMTKDIETDIYGRDVLLVEDIADSGQTLSFLCRHFRDAGAASTAICVLIDKLERRREKVPIDYRGFSVESGFLVGYGLDCAERFRNLPSIYTMEP